MIRCTFSEIKEQTPKDLLSACPRDTTAVLDHTCIIITTRGGQEFLVNTRLPVIAIYPLDDGIIIKCKFKSEHFQSAHDQHYCYMTLTGHPLNDIHPLATWDQQSLLNTRLEMVWVSDTLPLLITYELEVVQFSLLCRNPQNQQNTTGSVLDFQQRHAQLPQIAQYASHRLAPVFSKKMGPPSKAVLTQGVMQNEICVSLFSAKDSTVYIFKSGDLSFNFQLQEKITGVQSISEISFLRIGHSNKILNQDVVNAVSQNNFDAQADDRQFKQFKTRLGTLSHEQAFLNVDGDKIHVYYGGHNLLYTRVLQEPGASLITQNGLITRVHYPNGKQVDLQLSITISDFQIASITNLIKYIASGPDQIAFLKRFVQNPTNNFQVFCTNFVELLCGPPPKESPQKKSPVKKLVTTASPTKPSLKSALYSPVKKALALQNKPPTPIQSKTSMNPYQQMLEMRQQSHGGLKEYQPQPPKVINQAKSSFLLQTFKYLHLLHEDLQLQRAFKLDQFKKMMITLAVQLNQQEYLCYYQNQPLPSHLEQPQSLNQWIESKGAFKFQILFETTRILIRLYEVLFQAGQKSCFVKAQSCMLHNHSLFQDVIMQYAADEAQDHLMGSYWLQDTQLHLYEKILFTMNSERFGSEALAQLPYQVQLPFHDIVRYTRLNLDEVKTQAHWPANIYKLIQREDIITNLAQSSNPAADSSRKLLRHQSANFMLQKQQTTDFELKREQTKLFEQIKFIDDLIPVDASAPEPTEAIVGDAACVKARHNDTRHQEVEFLLRSDLMMKVTVPTSADLTEEERVVKSKQILEKMFRRQLAKCVGRGAMTLGTEESLPTQKLDIPKICPTAFIAMSQQTQLDESVAQPQQQTLNFDMTAREAKDMIQWPEFHNGVASALRIARTSFNSSPIKNARNWIMYHRPQTPKNEHGGFLLGLGLLGQLDSLQPTDVYQHLKTAHDSTTIGILLGRAASKIGRMDESDSKMMCLHIPALLPHTLSVDYSLPVQSAAVIGAGLLYQATSNRQITEMLLSQICKKPSSDKLTEREGYALASGLALGMVNLGAGRLNHQSNTLLFKELDLENRLIRFIEGGKTMPLPRSMLSQIQLSENFKSSAIMENDMVNTTITAPGAIVAITLIYLKSNNKQVADRIRLPQTFEAMDYVTPNQLILKVLARNLIMWDQIDCTNVWVKQQIPNPVRLIFECQNLTQLNSRLQGRIHENEIDFASIAQSVANIKAASVLSIGFKYAGTCDQRAKELILKEIFWFRKKVKVVQSIQPLGQIDQSSQDFNAKNQMDKNTVDSSLCICAVALSMVMAGSCDVDCFRALRVLRKRFEPDMHFGYNQAISQAFGILFLSNGQYTLSTSDKAIAGLLSAFYPIFPCSPQDNRHHLQALRHFYVFALETRLLQAKDIDTGAYVSLNATVEVQKGQNIEVVEIRTPEIINGTIVSIEAKNNPEYHDLQLLVMTDKSNLMQVDQQESSAGLFRQTELHQIIYVKRKQNQRGNQQQNYGPISLQDLLTYDSEKLEQAEIVALQTMKKVKDASIQAYLKLFCERLDPSEALTELLMCDGNDVFSVQAKVNSIIKANQTDTCRLSLLQLHECYTRDQLDSLPLLLAHILGPPLNGADVTPTPLIKSKRAPLMAQNELAQKILEALANAGEQDTVEKYKQALRAGKPLSGALREIQHAIEMCGEVDFNLI